MSSGPAHALCPSCTDVELVAQGSRLYCEKCRGVLITRGELEEMLAQMAPDDARGLDARFEGGASDPDRACPVCKATMVQHVLYSVTIDRCADHGIWFDGKELSAVLERGGDDFGDRAPVPADIGPRGLAAATFQRGMAQVLFTPRKR